MNFFFYSFIIFCALGINGSFIDFDELILNPESEHEIVYDVYCHSFNVEPFKLTKTFFFGIGELYSRNNSHLVPVKNRKINSRIFNVYILLKDKSYHQKGIKSVNGRVRFVSYLQRCAINQLQDQKTNLCYFLLRIKKLKNLNALSKNELKKFDFYDPEIISSMDNESVLDNAVNEYLKYDVILLKVDLDLLESLTNKNNIFKKFNKSDENFLCILEYYEIFSSDYPSYKYSLKLKDPDENYVPVFKIEDGKIYYSNHERRENIDKLIEPVEKMESTLNLNHSIEASFSYFNSSKMDEVFNLSLNLSKKIFFELERIIEGSNKSETKATLEIVLKSSNGSLLAKTNFEFLKKFYDFNFEKGNFYLILIDESVKSNQTTLFKFDQKGQLVFSRYVARNINKKDENIIKVNIELMATHIVLAIILILIFLAILGITIWKKTKQASLNEPAIEVAQHNYEYYEGEIESNLYNLVPNQNFHNNRNELPRENGDCHKVNDQAHYL